ncbi:MAG TPA: hypothetical protein VH234_04885 [Candidatus Saccharimonadales bacterium]|nr:hypothetical protein [Candidatus Saccharimonadales bacterium]
MSQKPQLRLIEGGRSKEGSSNARRVGLGSIATAGVASLTLALLSHGPSSSVSAESAAHPLPVAALKADRQVPVTARVGDGEDDLIAAVEPEVLTANPSLKAEVEGYIDEQANGNFIQVGQTLNVPVVTARQLNEANHKP